MTQSSGDLSVFAKSIRLSETIGLPRVWKADSDAEICLIFYKKRNKLFHEVPRREGDLEVSSAIQVAMQTPE